jgi:transcriptional regulator with XRE-family HTH domain
MKKKLGKAISRRLKGLRDKANLSQQDLATKADLSVSLVAKLEQGKKADPRASTLLALADALGVKAGALLEDLFPPEPAPATEAGPGANGEAAPAPEAEPDRGKGKKKKDKSRKKARRR